MALCPHGNYIKNIEDTTSCGLCNAENYRNRKFATNETKAKTKQLKILSKEPIKSDQSTQTYNEQKLKSFRSSSKLRNTSTEYNGLRYDSKLEAKVAQELDWKLKAGEIKEWRRQVKIPLKVNEVHITNYYIDFIYVDKDGQVVYLEVKGLEMPLWKVKWKLLIALINEIDQGAKLEVVKA